MRKQLQFLSAALAAVCLLSSCGTPVETEPSEVVETSKETEKETEAVKESLKKTVTMKEAADKYNALGRTYLSGDSLVCDHAASGVDLALECQGDVVVRVTAEKDNTTFTVDVDGKATKAVTFQKGTHEYTVASGLEDGFHVVRLVSEAGYSKPCKIDAVTFEGTMIKMYKNDLYIEFIGDSISAGYGLGSTAGESHDATLAYPYLTAQKLGADYSICALSGLGIAYGAADEFENYYPYQSVSRGKTAYTPEKTPDLVVINLHTNDNYQWYSKGGNVEGDKYNYATFDAKFDDMIKTIEGNYGKDIPMLFVFGCMASDKWTLATDRSIELIEEKYVPAGYDMKVVTLFTSRDGVEAHPSASGAKKQADQLAQFIRENYQ